MSLKTQNLDDPITVTDLLLDKQAQSEATHEEDYEGQTRHTDSRQTQSHSDRETLPKHKKIIGIVAGVLVIGLIVVVPIAVNSSRTGNPVSSGLSTNILGNQSADSSLSPEEPDWKSCNGVNVNISNQELSFKGSQDHCAKYQARLLDMNSAKTIQDCIMDNDDYWIGQDCDLTMDLTCKVFSNESGFVSLHHSTERRFICIKNA
ncbi:uncharacterized protein LOC108717261 isoform X2 [Xenopus laevis]|uniref:Uncharacterized protein LOC108717261 isoform X2 n=1 Tax=Xenopus laevis TaxID=8355 RepID=A0A8J1KQF2_XENLA|nr:uncharacterized protein LOC108717261 isoform X2 [Xenopus laevis]